MHTNPILSPTSSLDGEDAADGDLPAVSEAAGALGTGLLPATAAASVAPLAAALSRAFPTSVLQTIDIRHHVPVVTDLHASNFSQCRRFFLTVVGIFGIRDHLTAEAAGPPRDPDWQMIDQCVVH